ncbi:anti-phage ZorAB system protein ZorA [Hahella sp. NBU794]|uniref:anti-phage ZorAB system protein ZorA n=1 Tax=Hahella sp. NBU794 TaxID=3422590 RepID=UPI003D6F04CA
MKNTEYSLGNLWPEFGRILQWDITSPEGLSALVVLALIIIALTLGVWSLINYDRAIRRLQFYTKLLAGLDPEELLEKQREILNHALKSTKYGKLWREFDESLVHIPQKRRLCNTLDAAHFFNTHTLASGLTENRLIAAVPGFLTAIGVIGTFAGLQMGLAELNVTSEDFNELKTGIAGLIGGASIAFMTSVWGVLTSVIFNIYEKLLERNIRGKISQFQNEVDYLYPRITAEQSLSNIEDSSRQSLEKLAELDEKIGHKMQEAMREASGAISASVAQSLNSILAPAISKLVDSAHSGSEKALESLLERFLTGIGSAGESQRAMMEQAAQEISNASGGMTQGLSQFTNNLEQQVKSLITQSATVTADIEAQLTHQLSQQRELDASRQQQLQQEFGGFLVSMEEQMRNLSQQSAQMLEGVQATLGQQVEEQQKREIARQRILHDQLGSFNSSQVALTESVEKLLARQEQQHASLQSALSTLLEDFKDLSKSHRESTQGILQAGADMKASSNQLGLLSVNIKSATDAMTDKIQNAVSLSASISEQSQALLQAYKDLSDKLQLTNMQMEDTAINLDKAAQTASQGMSIVGSHFDRLATSLKAHIEDLEKQIAELLADYADRVQAQTSERLSVWNEQTNSYLGVMTDAVRTLSEVVDEVDSKVSIRTGSHG